MVAAPRRQIRRAKSLAQEHAEHQPRGRAIKGALHPQAQRPGGAAVANSDRVAVAAARHAHHEADALETADELGERHSPGLV